ncbi:glycan-binding surface protein [uncultured Acetobacteroides sp.]|uniref:glycan-binding surface protein n=1 Tax=uncultured Acetobacteroides sp. TaxID=1760811 RepID=UPI0029F477C6|nr:glycan-binding surface protein [uncultured Acetobacteroides sp.]
MKKLHIKYLLFFALISAMMMSCDDIVTYNDGYDNGLTSTGAPTIAKISPVNSRESSITEGALAQMIVIQGENLSGVKSITINDVEVDLTEAYIKAKEIVLPIPRVLPTTVNNKLVVTTQKGVVSVDFKVVIPDLKLDGLYNDFVNPGDTARIEGDFFDLYKVDKANGSVTLGGNKIDIIDATGSEIRVKIPDNAVPGSKIVISSPLVKTPLELKWRDTGIQLLNYADLGGYNWIWAGANLITSGSNAGDPKPLIGYPSYSRVVRSNVAAWDWFVIFGGNTAVNDADVVAHPENYWFKFEINTKSSSPLAIGNMIFQLNGGQYSWNPAAGGISFNTYEKWRTVKLDLKTFMGDKTIENGRNPFNIIFLNTALFSCDLSLVNFRIVHK